LNISLTLS